MFYKLIGILLLFGGLIVCAATYYSDHPLERPIMIYSSRTMLLGLWNQYKGDYVSADGRTIDPQRQNVTTSEGQSYTMLRAAWLSDKETFDLAWNWTKNNLRRKEDSLFSWLYGSMPNGRLGILVEEGGYNTASDADSDIALSLIFAFTRWQDPQYLREAKNILHDIWSKEVVRVDGKYILASNNLEKFSGANDILINPSYFSPYAYRIFAKLDPEHDWLALVQDSYAVIGESINANLDSNESADLPPDWARINRTSGNLTATLNPELSASYGYEAARLTWRLALDYSWFNEPRAKEVLQKMNLLQKEWAEKNKILASYSHSGLPTGEYETPYMYGASLGYFLVTDPKLADEVYREKLLWLYNSGNLAWKWPLSYYDTNWAWFGVALYEKMLPNLSPFDSQDQNSVYLSQLPA